MFVLPAYAIISTFGVLHGTHPAPPATLLSTRPAIGHTTSTSMIVWARASAPGDYELEYWADTPGAQKSHVVAHADTDHDLCMTWSLTSLTPGAAYTLAIHPATPSDAPSISWTASALRDPVEPQRASIGFGSCDMDPWDKPQPIWHVADQENITAFCFIGDTPYIDSTDLATQRRRYREFFSNQDLSAFRQHTPTYAVWDDHDFGKNDTDGQLPGKEHARQAFMEYHPNPSFGEANLGTYCSFRSGPVEVFLIDARWFSGTEPSFANPDKTTLIGAQQWDWLRKSIRASTATFKLLVTGMVWNDAVRPNKTDYWGHYPHERDAVFRFVNETKVPGVVLIGGDVHRSRAFRNPTLAPGAYPLYEFVVSPLGDQVHANAEVPHPTLLFDRGEPRVFLAVTADTTVSPARLTARWINVKHETVHTIELTADDLTYR